MENSIKKFNRNFAYLGILIIEIAVIIFLFSFFSNPVSGGAGLNTTVITSLQVGNVFPEVLDVDIDGDVSTLTLTVNSTKTVYCAALLRDYNNDTDITNVTVEFFDNVTAAWGDADDNNEHYTNVTCNLSRNYTGSFHGFVDDEFLAIANCSFRVWYYANPQAWNCTVFVNDTYGWNDTNSSIITTNELLAVSLPSTINYGTVNSTFVSNENATNVSNAGNVKINLSLTGYAVDGGDGVAMNCTVGNLKNISIMYEKYNLTSSNGGALTLTQFESKYANLTSAAVIKKFELDYRREDTENEAYNATYWRIYVPRGVAGTCQGNIIFGATKAAGSF